MASSSSSSYDLNPILRPRLRLPLSAIPMPPLSSSHLAPSVYNHHQAPLSLFQQTLREKEEEFYKTFPAARLALEAELHDPDWHSNYSDSGVLSGCGFQLAGLDHDLSLHTHLDHLSINAHPLYPAAPPAQGMDHLAHRPVDAYSQDTPAYAAPMHTPVTLQHEPMAHGLHIATSPVFNDPYLGQLRQQQSSSPVMDSLPSPDSSSDTSSAFHSAASPYHTSPQQPYYTPTPPSTVYNHSTLSSPVHQDPPVSLNPPSLVQATYNYGIEPVNGVKTEPEQPQYSTEPMPPPPQHESSVPPSRRNSHHITSRSQRRYSPQYTRPHKSGGSSNAGPVSTIGSLGWSPSPTSSSTRGAGATAAPTATTPSSSSSPSSSTSTLIMTRRSTSALNRISSANGKRHPEKKPALACVFCRGRKIACGPPVKDGDGKTCNQCQRRSLTCEYPTESRRGMRKKPATLNMNPNGPKVVVNRKR